MNTKNIIKYQKNSLMFHRMSYILFMFYVIVCVSSNVFTNISYVVTTISVTAICFILEETFNYLNFLNNVWILRGFRFFEYFLVVLQLMVYTDDMYSAIIFVMLAMLFLFDLIISTDLTEKYGISWSIFISVVPFVFVMYYQKNQNMNIWVYYFFSELIFILVVVKTIYSYSYILIEHNENTKKQILLLDNIEASNLNLLNYQKRINNVNIELNLQKREVEKANDTIQQANYEMMMQVEMLKYIASSFDVPKIINTIADTILSVKSPGFCAIYISKDIYLNKYPNNVVKTSIASITHKIRDEIDYIFNEFKENNYGIIIDDIETKDRYDFLTNVNINSVLYMPLCLEDDMYGILIVGDREEHVFDDNISYYEVTIAQFNIAVKNAIIYNQVQHMARKDGLTGINNRTYFNQLFKETIDEIVKKDKNISVALFDIDNFKRVNDTYGHLMGDEVIKAIATATEELIDMYDGFVCRYGGEEFVAVLPNKNIEVALPIIEELHEKIANMEIEYNNVKIKINVSIGLTSYPETCDNPDNLLLRADWTMYYSKEHGRGCITVDNEDIK